MRPSIDMPFNNWQPDTADYWSNQAATAQGCLPTLASPNYESIPSVSLTAIGNINGSNYLVNAVKFDGTTSYLNSAGLTGIADGKKGTLSCWIRIDTSDTPQYILSIGSGIAKFDIQITSGRIFILGKNSSGTGILNISTTTTYSPGSTWYNILASWDLSTATTNLYINGVSDKTVTTATNDTINYSAGTATLVGRTNSGASTSFTGSLSELWFDPTSTIDFTNASNRALFFSSGFPVNLGSAGQTPTGSSPILYLKSAASTFNTNSGTGGNFTSNGTFAIASSAPSDATTTQYIGAFTAIDGSDTTHTYAGTTNKIAEVTNSTANNLSKAGGYTAQDIWKFTQFTGLAAGNLIIATDYNDAIQSMTVGGTVFADLAAAAPKASAIATVNQFLMVGDTNGGTYNSVTQGAIPNRVWWSGIGTPTSWPDPATTAATAVQSGFKDLPPNLGRVQDIRGRYEYGVVFQENGLSRFQYQGGDVPFYITTYNKQIGCYCRNSPMQIGNDIYFIHSSGFYKTNGVDVEPIGHNMVDQTFLADLNTKYLDHVHVSWIPDKKIILWSYPSVNMTLQGTFPVADKVIAYNYVDGRWAMGLTGQTIDILFPAKSLAYTMEQLDSVNSNLDLITPSLDDPYWNGGNPIVGLFGIQLVSGSTYASYYGSLTGTPGTAVLDTKTSNLNQGGRAMITAFKPVVLGGSPTITGQIGTQKLLTDAITFGSAITPETRTGKCSARAEGVFHTVRLNITGSFTNALGVEPEWKQSGYA